jgi:opacity protein-like surface antigen
MFNLMLVVLILLGSSTLAQAESYVSGFIGTTFKATGGDIEIKDPLFPPGTTADTFDLKSSLVYGGKVGHFLNNIRWLGFEAEAFTTTPDIKEQTRTLRTPAGASLDATFAESDVRVTTLAFNVIARYPGTLLQPYVGAGVGLFFADVGDDQSDTAPGLNLLAGLRLMIFQHLSLFGEYKYNRVDFSFSPTSEALGVDTTYEAHHLVFGASFHF